MPRASVHHSWDNHGESLVQERGFELSPALTYRAFGSLASRRIPKQPEKLATAWSLCTRSRLPTNNLMARTIFGHLVGWRVACGRSRTGRCASTIEPCHAVHKSACPDRDHPLYFPCFPRFRHATLCDMLARLSRSKCLSTRLEDATVLTDLYVEINTTYLYMAGYRSFNGSNAQPSATRRG